MQNIYTHISETNYVPREYSVAAIIIIIIIIIVIIVVYFLALILCIQTQSFFMNLQQNNIERTLNCAIPVVYI